MGTNEHHNMDTDRPEEFNLNEKMSRWIERWYGKKVTGRTLGELKQIQDEFIKQLKETIEHQELEDWEFYRIINKLAGDELLK